MSQLSAKIWRWDRGHFLIEVYTPKEAAQISKWNFAQKGPSFGVNYYRRQFFIPAKKLRQACKSLSVTYTKNPNRVKAGRQAALNHPVKRGQNQKMATSAMILEESRKDEAKSR